MPAMATLVGKANGAQDDSGLEADRPLATVFAAERGGEPEDALGKQY